MEILPVVVMLAAGGVLALFVVTAMSIAARERGQETPAIPAPQRDAIAASLLVNVLLAGGMTLEEAVRHVRRGIGLIATPTTGIDLGSWADRYARMTDPQQRRALLETAVQLVAGAGPVPVRQYAALLDLSFGLGFQTDALARLREVYGFEYVDHAKDARPRSADRVGGGAPLFVRNTRSRDELLRVLGLGELSSRQELSAAYRRLVSQHHPDRFHGSSPDEQSQAAARFIEITRAYEELIRMTS
jgi:hypothetical protein